MVRQYETLYQKVYHLEIKGVLDDLNRHARFISGTDFFYQLDALRDNYQNLLRYSYEGYKDKQQQQILDNLCTSLLRIIDTMKYIQLEPELRFRKSENVRLQENLPENMTGNHGLPSDLIHLPTDLIFRFVWLTDYLNDSTFEWLRRINGNSKIPWHTKCLIVSALNISLLFSFDLRKFTLLLDFIESKENQVYQRALTGLVLALIKYDQRLSFYPELVTRLELLAGDEVIRPELELVLFQHLMAQETERITHEFESEVLPEMRKMMPKIEDKLQFGDQQEEEDMEGKNPGWKDMIEEVPGLFEKIEKYSRMQMEGGDVFMSTFKLLKRFDFFNTMSNWFVPFHRDHPDISGAFSDSEEINQRLIESLEKAFYICNSDKYSFAFNFQAIPAQQRSMIVTNFEAEFAQMKEMASEEELLDQSLVSKAVYIQYIQDLYRFFKLFPARQEFEDVFNWKISLPGLNFYRKIFERPVFTEKIAGFYIDKDYYPEAIELYLYLTGKNGPRGDLFEKAGYCYQKSGDYKNAVAFYEKAELFDTNRQWLIKKLGFCHLKMKNYQQALGYFKEVAELSPEDTSLQLQVARCYLHLKEYQEALNVYDRLLFFDPDDLRLLRPAAYCQFVLGHLGNADESYSTLLRDPEKTSCYDLMNAAHVKLCRGERKAALELYRESFSRKSPGTEAMLAAFNEDVPFLIKYGIPSTEIPLIRDYLLYQIEP